MLSAAPTDLKNAQPEVAKRGNGRLPKINKSSGEQLSLVADIEAHPSKGQPPEAEPPKRKRGRPSKAELAVRAAAQLASARPQKATGKKERKAPERLTEEERTERYLRIARAFPHPEVVTPKQALEQFPELAYLQNAYGFLKSAAKRGLAENMGNGQFRFTASAAAELQNSVGHAVVQPQSTPASAPKSRQTIPLRKEPLAPAAPQPGPAPSPVTAQAAAPVAVSALTPAPPPVADAAPKRVVDQVPAPVARPAAEPALAPATRRVEESLGTLLQLSRRYRSERYYNVDDFIVPLRECRDAVFGDANIDTVEPPVCVVVDAYEADPKAVNPNDIDVLFLDVKGQAHIRSAASWQFLPYQKR